MSISKADLSVVTNFPQQYYALVAKCGPLASEPKSMFNFVDYFEENGFSSAKNTRENFISLRESVNPDWGINASPSGKLEVIFVSPIIGFTFHGLAYDGAVAKFPELVPSPRYPRIPLPNEDGLYELAQEVRRLYGELKWAIQKAT